jgi:hypothetical protein
VVGYRRLTTGLGAAAIVSCALFLLEDPAVIAVRSQLRHRSDFDWLAIDLGLALVMVGYNVAASRFVSRVAGSERILVAFEMTERRRSRRGPTINPFELLRSAFDFVASGIGRAGNMAERRGHARWAGLLAEVSLVNVFGVPGLALDGSRRGSPPTPAASVRHSILFVGSWFLGAHAVGAVLDAIRAVPIIGDDIAALLERIGAAFLALTDVTTLLGAVVIGVAGVAVLRYSVRVTRLAESLEPTD